jgi:5,10-methylenetetrahydromethanopterin reductase
VTERFGLGITNCRPAREVVEGVRWADELGAEIAFIAEDINCRDAFQLAALSALQTKRIHLGPGVTNPYTRNPTALAMAAATLEEVSGGRAVLGLGASGPNLIRDQMGLEYGDSAFVLREAATIVRSLLRAETVTFAGDRFRYAGARLEVPVTRPAVPIFFAAMGPRTLRLAGEHADGVLLNVGSSMEYVSWAVRKVREGARRAGCDEGEVTIAAWLTAYVIEDREEGLRRARRWLSQVLSIPRQGELLLEHGGFETSILPAIRELVGAYPHRGDREAAGELVPREWAEKMTLIGDVDEVRRRVEEYRAAGVDVPVMGIGVLRRLYG